MSVSLPAPFPDIDISKDYNPGIRLFGKRFISEQTIVAVSYTHLDVYKRQPAQSWGWWQR